MTDDEPVAQFHDRNRNETSPEMAWKTTLTAASPSLVSGPNPDSTFSTPPSASRSLLTDWTVAGPLGAGDPGLTKSNSGFNDVAFTAGNEQSQRGYLLQCDVNDLDQVYSPIRDWTENISNASTRALYEVRQISSSDSMCFGKKCDGKESHLPAHPVNNLSSSDTDSASSTESSIVSLPNPKATPISSSIEALPTFMSPIETVKPCPQNCRCHGCANISSTNNSNMIYPLPDLLNYTTPDQFSITSSTTSMTSPLVCPRPFQPPSTFQPFRPGFIGDEGRYSAPSSASGSLSFVSSAAEASDIQPGPNKQGRAYPVQVVPSALLTSLVQEGLVGRGIGNELTTPTTASTITTSTSEMERTQQVVPTSFPPNCNIPGDDVVTRARPVASSHTSYYYPQAYPPLYLTRFQTEFPLASRLPTERLSYLPSEHSNHFPVGNPPHPARPPPPGYHLTPGYHAHPPPDYPSSLILSRLLAPRSLTATCDPRMAIIPPHRGCFPRQEDGQPRTSVVEKEEVPSVVDKEKVPPKKRRPNRRPGRRLVDQYPDLLPVIAWCIKYLQAATSYSLGKPNIPVKKIHEIVVECIPGIKERGGIGMDTIRRLASDARRKMRDESATPSSTSLLSQVSHTVVTENNSKRLSDSISTSFKRDDDSELPRAPPESILRSIMKLVENIPKTGKHSRSTATTTASTTHTNMTSRDRKLAPDGNTVAVSSDFHNDTREGSTFQSLVDDIIEGEVEKTSRKSEVLCSSSSAGNINRPQAQSPVKPSHFEPEIAVGDKRVDGAKDSTKCSDCDSDDDIMVIDEASTVGQSEDFVVCSDLSVFL